MVSGKKTMLSGIFIMATLLAFSTQAQAGEKSARDAGTRSRAWVYVASEAGILSVFKIQGSMVVRIGEGRQGPNAHVVAVDPAIHRPYFPFRNLNGKTALHIMKNRP